MKKALFVLALLTALFTGCPQPTDNTEPEEPAPSLTIKNESSYDLSQVLWSGISFTSPNSSDLLKTNSVNKPVNDQTLGYITFIRKDIGITCRTDELINIPRDGPFIFTNNTVVIESGNDSNKKNLSLINFISHIVIESNGRTVPKQDTVSLGETVLNNTKEIAFTLKNTGVGKLILNGNEPVKISGEPLDGTFAVIQPSASEIASGSSLLFTIRFTPKAIKAYAATVTISSNAPSGDYTFSLSGAGVAPKPIITIWHGENEISQNGTVELGEGIITQSKTAQIRIKNTGTLVLNTEPTNITITGTDAAAFSMISSPIAAISEGNESTFTVQFSPTSTGEKSAAITIPNDDSSRNPAVIIIKGTGKQEYPVIELKNNTTVIDHNGEKDFGRVEIGQTKTESFSIKNTGLVNLVLSGESLVSSSSAKFAIITQPKASLSPNEETSFTVRYTPDVEQEDEAEISISGNTQSGLFKFTVKGTGYTKKPQIGIFYGSEEKVQNGLIDIGDLGIHVPSDIEITIKNSDNTVLTLMPDDITITGTNSDIFLLKNKPAYLIPIGGESKCIIQCTLLETREYNAIITVPNDDPSRNPAVFFIKTVGVLAYTDMELSYNGTNIENHTGLVDFGSVEIGDFPTKTFVLKNTGRINLKLDGNPIINSSDTDLFSVVMVPSKTELLPNETVQFTVRYTPQTEGLKSAEITIPCNIQAGAFMFETQGTGYTRNSEIVVKQGGAVFLNEGIFNFGSITTIGQKAVTFTIANTGDAHLTLSNNPAVYVAGSNAFSITQQPSASIAPNGMTSFTVQFSSTTAANSISATVIIKSNSKENDVFFLRVEGSSYQAIPATPSILSVIGDIHTVMPIPSLARMSISIKRTYYPITVSWTASPCAEKYKIYYATSATRFTSMNYTTVMDATSATILAGSTIQYQYIKISAVNGAGESEPTAVRTITRWTTSSSLSGSSGSTR